MTVPAPSHPASYGAMARIAERVPARFRTKIAGFSALHAEQMRFLSQSSRLEEGGNSAFLQLATIAASLSVFGFIVWAGMTEVVEVARAPGQVVPLGFEQTVQHADGGIISKILAEEGEVVKAGQPLLTLDGSGVREDLEQARKKQWALSVSAERIRAFVEHRTPDFAALGPASQDQIAEQEAFFKSMVDSEVEQSQVIRRQIAQKEDALGILQRQRETEEANLETINKLYASRRELYEKGLMAFGVFAQTQQQKNTQDGMVANLKQQVAQANEAISEYKSRLVALSTTSRDQKNQELHALLSEIAQNSETVKKLEERSDRLELRSPINGVIKGLGVNTVGGIVKPGQILMSVVPVDGELVVETQIETRYIGSIHKGQEARIKVSSYDFSKYGHLEGTVENVSATTFVGANGEPFYRARVKLSRLFMDGIHKRYQVLPGMTVTAEIVTGKKTILEYLLKPLRNAIDTAMTET